MFRYKTEMEAWRLLMLLGDTTTAPKVREEIIREWGPLALDIYWGGTFGKEQETKLKKKAKSILST